MIYERLRIDGEDITLCAEEENAWIKVWVNGIEVVDLPLVHNGELTIKLTEAGLAALEEKEAFGYEDDREVEFMNYD